MKYKLVKTAKNKLLTGFTMIELVISIFILSMGLVGIFSAFSVMSILASDTADRFTATYLAQEGMEIVRNIRETNWLRMDACLFSGSCPIGTYSWDDGFGNCANGCEVDYRTTGYGTDPVYIWSNNGNYLNIEKGFYIYEATNPSPTKFKRKIIIKPVKDVGLSGTDDHIIMVEVQVSWKKKATILESELPAGTCNPSNCITTKGTLYNWYNYVTQ